MAKFCTYCGAPLEQDAVSCKECGVKVLGAEDNVQTAAPAPAPAPVQTPEPAPAPAPQTAQASAKPATDKNLVTSTSAFFWLSLLFSLPVIGFICSIIFSFASKKINTKHFARAAMLWYIVGMVAAILMFVIGFLFSLWLGVTLSDIIYELGYYFTF